MFFVLGWTLGLSLVIFGLRLGALGVHLVYFYRFRARPWTPCPTFLGQARTKYKHTEKKGAEMDAFPMAFRVFPENTKVRFDCAGLSGLRLRPLLFLLCASIVPSIFCVIFGVF